MSVNSVQHIDVVLGLSVSIAACSYHTSLPQRVKPNRMCRLWLSFPPLCRYQPYACNELPLAETGDNLLYGYTYLSLTVGHVLTASCRQQCYSAGPVSSHFSATCLLHDVSARAWQLRQDNCTMGSWQQQHCNSCVLFIIRCRCRFTSWGYQWWQITLVP